MVNRRDLPEPPGPPPDNNPWATAPDPGMGEVYGPPRYNVGTGPSHAAPPKRLMPKKRKIWPWVVIAIAVLLFGSCAAIIGNARSNTDQPVRVAPVPSQAIEAPTPSPATTAPKIEYGKTFGDGEWLVGKDKEIEPGTYRTPGAREQGGSYFCALIIKKAGNIVDSASSSGADEPARVILKEGQTANSQGCQPWTKVGE